MNDYLLGIEWLTSEIIIACLKRKGNSYQISRLDRLLIDDKSPEPISQLLKKWKADYLPKNANVVAVLSLSESQIFLKEISLPKAKDQELDQAIFWETSSLASILPSEAIVQWKKISENAKTIKVVTMATKSQTIEEYLEILQEAEINVLAIEPASISFTRIAQEKLDKVTLLLNIEEGETNLVILENGTPIFSSSVSNPLGGMATQRRRLRQDIKSLIASWAKKVITYWEEKDDRKIMQVILTGDGIKYSGLAQAINQFAHVPTVISKYKSFKNIRFSDASQLSQLRFLVAVGAAMRPIVDLEELQVNFLPIKEKQILQKEKARHELVKRVSIFTKINFIVLVLAFCLLTGLKLWRFSTIREVRQTKIFVQNHPAQKYLSEVLATNNLLNQVDFLVSQQKDTGTRLRQIAQLVPVNLKFTSLGLTQTTNEEWIIEGTGDRKDILAFYEKIKKDAGATEISMPYSNLQKETEGVFKITIKW